MRIIMTNKSRMIKLAQDFYTQIGYPISSTAEYEYRENTLFIFENMKCGKKLTHIVFDRDDEFEIVNMRGQTKTMLQQPKDYLPY
jgi:hypothetical protein